MAKIAIGTFLQYPTLIDALPPLVRTQRRFEALLGDDHGPFEKQEKAIRADIDLLLKAAGLTQAECVTCNGYDVTRRGQKGRSAINAVKLLEQLVAAGLDRAIALKVILDSTDTGDPSTWSEVKPSKGAMVRASRPAGEKVTKTKPVRLGSAADRFQRKRA